jgi:hypothetical protein
VSGPFFPWLRWKSRRDFHRNQGKKGPDAFLG